MIVILEVFLMKKVLLPIDGSKRSLRSVEMVKQVCSPKDTEITIVKVIGAQLYLNTMEEIKTSEEKARPELETVAAMLKPEYTVTTKVLPGGNPGVEIVQFARENKFNMIIMTRSSRGPLRKLGSVATHIVRNANFINVIVMRENDEE